MDEPQNPSPRPTEPPPSDPPPVSPPPYAPPPPPVYQSQPPPAQKSKLPWILGGCGCLTLLALLVAGGVGSYWYGTEKLSEFVRGAVSITPTPTPTSSPSLASRPSPTAKSSPTPRQTPTATPEDTTGSTSSGGFGKRLEFKDDGEVFYTSRVTEAEAKKLGAFLEEQGFFGGAKKSVQLNKTGTTYEFRMVVKENIINDESKMPDFKAFARALSSNVFNGSPVAVHLCDNQLKTLRVIPAESADPSEPITEMKSAAKTYVSAKDKLPAALAERFVAFSFDYPPAFTIQPQEDEIFVTLQKMGGTDGKKVTQTFTIGWYEPPDPETRQQINEVLTNQTKKWTDFLPTFRCRELRKSAETVGGVEGRSVLVQFTTRDGKSTFVAAGKTIVVRPTGEDNGVAISLYGTWEDSAIKSASDLGVNDDLAKILRSFKFL